MTTLTEKKQYEEKQREKLTNSMGLREKGE